MSARRLGWSWLAWWMALAAAGLIHVAAADEASRLREDLTELMDLGFKARLRALEPVEERFDELRKRWPAEPRLDYALALVQLKHRQYSAAAETLARVIEASPDDLHARRALVWTLVVSKKHQAALAEMDRTAERLAEGAAADDELRSQTAQFLGRMIGYLAGPGAGSVKPDRLEEAQAALAERLEASLAEDLAQGRDAVLARYDELALHEDQAREEAREDQEDDRDRLAAQLADEQRNVETERSQLESEGARARQAVDDTISQIDRRLAPLHEAFARLESRAADLADRIADLDEAVERLLDRAQQTCDPLERDRLLREADRLAAISDRHRAEYAELDRQARAINAERSSLQAARQQAIADFEEEQQRIDRRGGQLDRLERRIGRDEQRLDRPATGNSPKVRSMAAKLASLATYDDFPMEDERRRLVESIR